MNKTSQIRSLIRHIAGTEKPLHTFWLMEVVSVKGDVCVAKMDDFEVPNIRLSAIEGGSEKGLLITPSVGSIVLVADLSGGTLRQLAVVGFSQIDSVRLHQGQTTIYTDKETVTVEVGNSQVEISEGVISFNGGKLGGMVVIEQLTNKINELIRAFNTHTHTIPAFGVSATGTQTAQSNPAPLPVPVPDATHTEVSIKDYEDDKIVH
ncbi:MAG: hypothetical protein LUF04_07185 [Bacteroides sp.]|nr:hypothetical protein [Bacteroides sp.]